MRILLKSYKDKPVLTQLWTGAKELTIFVPNPEEGGVVRIVLREEEFEALPVVAWNIEKAKQHANRHPPFGTLHPERLDRIETRIVRRSAIQRRNPTIGDRRPTIMDRCFSQLNILTANGEDEAKIADY